MRLKNVLLFALLICSACSGTEKAGSAVAGVDSASADSTARARQDSINRTLPGYVVDSILPVEEELRRFRAAVGGIAVRELEGGTRSREALVARFRRALASSDTAALRTLLLTPREFADLVYPESQYTRPPYRQSPALVWQQIQNAGASGFSRLLSRMGGVRIPHERETCEKTPQRTGDNTIYAHCTIAVADSGGTTRQRQLFGPIIERHGRYKFVSYANEF